MQPRSNEKKFFLQVVEIAISSRAIRKERKSERRMPRLSGGEEGRGKLRKVAGICKQELIREYPNGATHTAEGRVLTVKSERTRGTETS